MSAAGTWAVIDLSRQVFEALRKDEELILYRGRSTDDGSQAAFAGYGAPSVSDKTNAEPRRSSPPIRILVLAPVAEHPPPESLKRLEYEYALREALDPTWAARPIAMVRHWDRTVLVLEDSGGVPLDRLLGQPFDLALSLRLAVGLSAAIDHLHQRGIIHKDLKPANILVNSVTGQCWLTGFGFASRLPRERQTPEPPEFIAGTLAYMAPEQTGRMNRSIDSRSDLYSLGVTLYEMLTGSLPFTASDPMEWVHCHIARQPVPPAARSENVPDGLSDLIMKLLAKTAEERYQTAAGANRDLRRCLDEWETQRSIDDFPLGQDDTPDRLLIPEKLYGRAHEIDTLLASFDRVVASGRPELVLVSGYSGIGKSSVVNELHKVLVLPRGLFASGKFDQHKRDIPYATLARAFQGLVRQILSKSDKEVSHWRHAIREALGKNGQLMVNLIPELELIIGKQPPVPDLAPEDAQNRFQLVFVRLLGVFARAEHPLALFLDDLQWLDAATLELIEHLMTEPEVRHLLLLGAYRDNEVSSSHPLMRKLEVIRKTGAIVHDIVLSPLGLDDVVSLVTDSLHCERVSGQSLAELVHEKTEGNPFFAIQFLTALAEEGLLLFDSGASGWTWNLAQIRAKGYTDNVVDLMAGKLSRLARTTQEALGHLACLGNVADIATLTLVQGESEEKIQSALWEAVWAGLVFRLESAYTFLHDRMQEAAYALIPESERAVVHLRIGRLLMSRTVPEEMEEKIFEIVSQLNRGAALIDSLEERKRVAELNLFAAQRAKASTAYASALTYLVAGRALLTEESWEQHYAIAFALELQRAECEFLTGNFGAAEQRLATLSRRAANLVDSAAVTRLQTELYAALDQSSRAVEAALEYLRRVGIDWSPHPTNDELRKEYERIWQQLGNRPIEALLDLPPLTDPAWLATLDVLTAVEEPAYFTDQILRCLVVARIVNLSLEHGNSDGSCVAYVQLGWFVGPRFDDYEAAFRFGKLGLDLVDKRGVERFRARVSQCFAYFINPWSKHLRPSIELLRRSLTTAQEAGDVKYAAYSCDRLITVLLAAGDPLGDVQREAENGLEFARKAKFGYLVDIIVGQLGFIRTLRGLTLSLSSFSDAEFEESRFEQHLNANPHPAFAACWYWIRKLQAHFYAGDYASALSAASKAEPLLLMGQRHFESAEYLFYGALARAAQHGSLSSEKRARNLETLVAHHKQIVAFAENCPENFENRTELVAAEIARIEGRTLDAESLYEKAIQSARQHGFVQNEAVAHEVAARFYAARGFEPIAHTYFRNARYCYLRWGAFAKVRHLDECYPHLHEERVPASPSTPISAPVEQLDLGTVFKASQTVSSEIVLEKLIEKLLIIALEQAGADRGLLILPRGGDQRIEAEARSVRDKIAVHFRESFILPSDLPESLLRYVVRTQQSVILSDASAENAFLEDEYIRRNRPRSVLCLPLVKQCKLIGILYLENNLAPDVFVANRLVALDLIASQAAISLDQARLYAELMHANQELKSEISERRRVEEALRRSEAYLSEAQRLSRTGSFGWDISSGKFHCSQETLRIFGYDPATELTLELVLQRTHPEDRSLVRQVIDRVSFERQGFDSEYRLLMPDGSVKHLRVVGHPSIEGEGGNFELVGAVTDITEGKRAEEAVQQAQTELAHVTRVTVLGGLSASIAHEINQPLAGIVTNGNASLRWLAGDSPNLAEAREAIRRIIRDGKRAGDVISRMRALFKKVPVTRERLNINEAIEEVLLLTQSELQRNHVALHVELANDLPLIWGDRIELQQVMLNLLINAVDAMNGVGEGPRELWVSSQKVTQVPGQSEEVMPGDKGLGASKSTRVLIAVRDSGPGLDPKVLDRLFDAFYTTKPRGLGVGLAISRSIIEGHRGHLWAMANAPRGAVFQFVLPIRDEDML